MTVKNADAFLRLTRNDRNQGYLARQLFEHAAERYIAMEAPDAVPGRRDEGPAFYTSLPGEPVTTGFLIDYGEELLRVTISREPRDV